MMHQYAGILRFPAGFCLITLPIYMISATIYQNTKDIRWQKSYKLTQCKSFFFCMRIRRLLETTHTLLIAIVALAIIGLIRNPLMG